MKNIIVKNSGIEGKGVFAARDFKKGDVVLKWDTSNELAKEQVDGFAGDENRYVNFHKGVYLLMQVPEKYVNHSCNANTRTDNFCDVAIRDIKRGEEVTSNYEEDNIPGVEMKCNCGSDNCVGIVK